jgi:hypothetical protein
MKDPFTLGVVLIGSIGVLIQLAILVYVISFFQYI